MEPNPQNNELQSEKKETSLEHQTEILNKIIFKLQSLYNKIISGEISDEEWEEYKKLIEDLMSKRSLFNKIPDSEFVDSFINAGLSEQAGAILENFNDLKEEIAFKLIANNEGYQVVSNLDKFKNLNHTEVAEELIKVGYGLTVASELDKFTGLNHIEIANKLIEAGDAQHVAENLEKFNGLNADVANKLIDLGEVSNVVLNLKKFNNLNSEIANKLIEAGRGHFIAGHLDRFIGLNHAEVANNLIDKGKGRSVAEHLEKFSNVNHSEIANKLILAGDGSSVAQNLNNFSQVSHVEIANKFLDTGQLVTFRNNIKNFSGLNTEIANKLIDAGEVFAVTWYLDRFKDLNTEIANKIINAGQGRALTKHLDKFIGLNYVEIANKLFDIGEGENVAEHLDKFIGLNHVEFANKLINASRPSAVGRNLEKFNGLNDEIANKLIEYGEAQNLARHLDKFIGLNHIEIANKLVEEGHGYPLAMNLEKFDGLNHIEIANKLIETNQGHNVAKYLEKFNDLNHTEIAYKLIRSGKSLSVLENLEKFNDLNHAELANKLIEVGQGVNFITHLEKFNGLDEETAKRLAEEGYIRELFSNKNLSEHYKSFSDEQLDQYVKKACNKNPEWGDELTIQSNFETGRKLFGTRKMLEYCSRRDVSLHDSVHLMFKIDSVINENNIDPGNFYEKILKQVTLDTSQYDEGSSYHNFNSIINNFSTNLDLTDVKMQEITDLVATFTDENSKIDPKKCFESWSKLKKFSQLQELLLKKELFKRIQNETNPKLRNYITSLALHKDSKVDMNLALLLYENPDKFLELEASHTPANVHDRKKPSNYTEINHLDLTGGELRDALIEGEIDKIAAIEPFEVKYKVNKNLAGMNLDQLVSKALGSKSKGIKGEAKDPAKLFDSISKAFGGDRNLMLSFIQGKEEVKLDEIIIEKVRAALFNPNYGMVSKEEDLITIIAKIYNKSDPAGAIAGNDTACCMPFGDGKNTVYTFNPNAAQLVLQIERNDGSRRTIAQSVLTKDIDIEKSVPTVINGSVDRLSENLPPTFLSNSKRHLACDNIEIARNFEGNSGIIQEIYSNFLNQYLKESAKNGVLFDQRVVIGAGYTAETNYKSAKNTYIPQAPVSYSDKLGENVYVIDTEKAKPAASITNSEITIAPITTQTSESPIKTRGVEYLNYEDSLKAGYLEEVIYKDNPSLLVGWTDIENTLIAKDINNNAKNRPNMCFKHTNSSGAMDGYLICYEGYIDTKTKSESILYVSDLAADRANAVAGGKLIIELVNQYIENYWNKGSTIPFYCEARDKTSYQIITNTLTKTLKARGIDAEIEELGTFTQGPDKMHKLLIKPIRTSNE